MKGYEPTLEGHLPFPSFASLEVRPSNPVRRSGECCKLPSGVWGRVLAEIDFSAFQH